jgi:trimeric autotransporter adhesin
MRFRLRRSLLPAAAALIGALVVAACGGSNNTSDQTGGGSPVTVTKTVIQTASTPSKTSTTDTGPQTNTAATKTSTTPTALGNECRAANLTPSYLGSNGAAGTIVLGFALKNTGATTCHTYGWPGVEFLSSSGAALATHATRTTGDVVGSTPAGVLTLAPGDEASFRMVTSDMAAGGGSCPTASALQIYAPDDTVTMKVGVPGVAACGKATLSPMMPGASAFAGQGGGGGQTGVGAGGSGGSGSGQGTGTSASGGSGLSGGSE